MKFIELSGRKLSELLRDDEGLDLHKLGVEDDTVVRINEQGDVEVRRPEGWDLVGGLLGSFVDRIHHQTGMEWA